MKNKRSFIKSLSNLGFLYKQIWKENKSYFPWALSGVIFNALVPFPIIIFLKPIIDSLFTHRKLKEIVFYVILMLGITLILKILIEICKNATDKKIEKIKNDLMLMIQQKSTSIPYHYLENPDILNCKQTAMEILKPVNSGFMDFRVIMQNFNEMITNLLKIISLAYLIIHVDIFLILLVAIITIIHSCLTTYAKKKEFAAWEKGLVTVARKLGYLQNISVNNSYAKEVRIYGLSNWISNKIENLTSVTAKTVSKNISRYAGVEIISNSMTVLMEGFTYAYLGWLVIYRSFTVGDFSMYTSAIFSFLQSIIGFSTNIISIFQTSIYLKEFKRYLKLDEDVKLNYDLGGQSSLSANKALRFDNVYFKYPGQDDYILKGINLTIHPNERLSIVGDNGAGKTTIIKLLLRLYEPTKGTIWIGDVDIKDMNYQEYISNFSVIFQDFKILAFSVLENITYDKFDNCEIQKIYKIIHDCGLKDNIDRLPNKLNTYVSKLFEEAGVELSGGEQQKLALCSAIYRNAPIVILDEPTAMLSPAAEYDIYTSFDKIIGEKTAIYISHRMSSCRFCNNIAVLYKGQIVEYGSHEQLIQLNQHYTKMFNVQADYYKDMELHKA